MVINASPLNKETVKRFLSTVCLLSYCCFVFYQGPLWIVFSILLVQTNCFKEVIHVAYSKTATTNSGLSSMAWYLHFIANYFLYCETLADHIKPLTNQIYILDMSVRYHRFVTFCLYFSGLKIMRRHGRHHFKFIAFVHVVLLLIVLQAYMVVGTVFRGIIWVLLTFLLVPTNDIFAYVVGRLFGKTPLIEVSPKKTWEGYIGGAIGTIVFGMILSHVLCDSDYLVCPIEYVESSGGVTITTNCTRSYMFTLQHYKILDCLLPLSVVTYPFVFHSLVMSSFASIVAPFGGFFASGFKRALNVKNFGDAIPGHGGVMDRFDCFYLMVTFVSVYRNTFAETYTVDKIFQKFLKLSEDGQQEFFWLLKKSLENRLSNSTDLR